MSIKTRLNRRPKTIWRAVRKLTPGKRPGFNNPLIETVWVNV